MMWVCEVPKMGEEHGEMRLSISQWGAEKDPLLFLPTSCRTPMIR